MVLVMTYIYEVEHVHLVKIPLHEDPASLETILAATAHVREIAQRQGIDVEDVRHATMHVELIDGCDYLVFTLHRAVERDVCDPVRNG